MSFPTDYFYAIYGRQDLLECTEIERGLAELLVDDPVIYENPEFTGHSAWGPADHEQFVKLLFLADLQSEYSHNFFQGNAPITVSFFDRWWLLRKCDAVEHVATIAKRLCPNVRQRLWDACPDNLRKRLRYVEEHGRNHHGESEE